MPDGQAVSALKIAAGGPLAKRCCSMLSGPGRRLTFRGVASSDW
jgi:hypothetical protein